MPDGIRWVGLELLEVRVPPDSPARGRRVRDIAWPPGSTAVAVTQGREIRAANPDLEIHPGERIIVLASGRAAAPCNERWAHETENRCKSRTLSTVSHIRRRTAGLWPARAAPSAS